VTSTRPDFTRALLDEARHGILERHLPRIVRCLRLLSEQDVWWRPNRASNSAGNLVLHLCGNVRQWIISGLGGAPDVRHRDSEFAERGPVPRRTLVRKLKATVNEAARVISGLSPENLEARYTIQGLRVPGFQAVFHVAEHFAFHSGQIQFITKLRRGRDLGFTRLPGPRGKAEKTATKAAAKLEPRWRGRVLPQI
jgi:uncharacterized damage-inducible protein DinB